MDFFEVVDKRQSIRKFTADKIDSEIIDRLLKTIRTAPTAGNLQAYRVFVVEKSDRIKALAGAAYDQDWIATAPAVLVFCADPTRSAEKYGDRGRNLYCLIDTTIAATFAQLAVAAQGLGSTMVGAFEPAKVAGIIDAESSLEPVLLLPIGYPDEKPENTPRKNMEELFVRV